MCKGWKVGHRARSGDRRGGGLCNQVSRWPEDTEWAKLTKKEKSERWPWETTKWRSLGSTRRNEKGGSSWEISIILISCRELLNFSLGITLLECFSHLRENKLGRERTETWDGCGMVRDYGRLRWRVTWIKGWVSAPPCNKSVPGGTSPGSVSPSVKEK